jgi:hypothetical protein
LFRGSFDKEHAVDVLQPVLQADPALAEFALEFSMAKKSLGFRVPTQCPHHFVKFWLFKIQGSGQLFVFEY